MGVTHVIRGDDHLNNAARQQQIYEAMGWRVPSFSHVPLIHGPDGAKLSKRHGALGVEAYRDMGILPEGLANYLLRLGWSHGDNEIIPREKALEWFDITGINRAPARLDPGKLEFTNAHYVKALSDAEFVSRAAPFFAPALAMLRRAASFLKDRSPTLAKAPAAAAFLFLKRPLDLSGRTGKPFEKEGARALVGAVANALRAADFTSAAGLEEKLKAAAETAGVGFGAIGPAVRAALTGGLSAPSLGEVLHALGREESLARLDDAARQ
jgi:glutamyl-tRNA synthetase